MKKLIVLIGLVLTGCATFHPSILLPNYHKYTIAYVNCLGSPIIHKGVLLTDSKKDGITLDENGKITKYSPTLCGVLKTKTTVVHKAP